MHVLAQLAHNTGYSVHVNHKVSTVGSTLLERTLAGWGGWPGLFSYNVVHLCLSFCFSFLVVKTQSITPKTSLDRCRPSDEALYATNTLLLCECICVCVCASVKRALYVTQTSPTCKLKKPCMSIKRAFHFKQIKTIHQSKEPYASYK